MGAGPEPPGLPSRPVPLARRLAQLAAEGDVELTPFSEAELATVTITPRSPLVRAVRRDRSPAPGPARGPGELLGSLTRRGFVEQAGDASPGGHPQGGGPAVLLVGDLAIVTSLRTSPSWVGEVRQVRTAGEETWREEAVALYGGERPAAVLEERAGGEGASQFRLRTPEAEVRAIMDLAGVGVAGPEGRLAVSQPEEEPHLSGEEAPVAAVLPACSSVTRVQVARPRPGGLAVRGAAIATRPGSVWWVEGAGEAQVARRVTPGSVTTLLGDLLSGGGDPAGGDPAGGGETRMPR